MPFPFLDVCTLLSRLEAVERHDPPLLPACKVQRNAEILENWFRSHRCAIRQLEIGNATALLSTLLPEWRTDRVYNLQATRLCKKLGRVLRLSSDRLRSLEAYKLNGHGDLAECVERLLQTLGGTALPAVRLNEVDSLMQQLASHCQFSERTIRATPSSTPEVVDHIFADIVHRMTPLEAKWLVRLLLKDLSPCKIEENLVFQNFHFLLGDLLQFQRNFTAAVTLLKQEFKEYPERPDPASAKLFQKSAAEKLFPVIGIKVGRPHFHKARGIEQCLSMLGSNRWVAERKYDGEYCEVHIDMSLWTPTKPAACIKIFSKSGKDSTNDRKGLHQVLIDTLGIGKPDCKVKHKAIVLGELVVYSDSKHAIMPFEHIRKHISRSGRFIGADADSPVSHDEHLAIILFDILLLDNEIIMRKSIDERRQWLRETCQVIPGRAMRSEWKIIDFNKVDRAKKSLIEQFAMSNVRRYEGLILKPCGVPYLTLSREVRYSYIKLKKDLMGMGDEADFAVIGASYDAQLAAANGFGNLKWTTFHLGSLLNKDDVRRFGCRPRFKHMGVVHCGGQCIPKAILQTANILGSATSTTFDRQATNNGFDIVDLKDSIQMDVAFANPFVFEVIGSKFAKPPNCNFMMLIFPRVKKLHQDRSIVDCPSFHELQEQAREANALPDTESQETRDWVERLERRCKRKFERDSTTSPSSTINSTPITASASCTPTRNSVHAYASIRPGPLVEIQAEKISHAANSTYSASPLSQSNAKRIRQTDGEHVSEGVKRSKVSNSGAELCKVRVAVMHHASPLSEISNNTCSRLRARTRYVHRSDGPQPVKDARCKSRNCLFSSVSVHLLACISRTLLIVEDLLPSHDVGVTTHLEHWDRDSFAHPRSSDIVSESQADQGMRKIVLVESKRAHAVRDLVTRLEQMNAGRFRERVDVYDWRVLEVCLDHDRKAEELKEYFLGATMFDATRNRTVFVHAI